MNDVLTIARNDFRSVRRSKLLWGVVVIYAGFIAIVFYPAGDDVTVDFSLLGAMFLTALLLPLVAITGSYLAVAGERESNTVRFLLSQPTTRRSVVIGKLLSRGLTLVIGLLIAMVIAAGMVLGLYQTPEFRPLVLFFGLTTLLVGAYTAASIGISAAVSSRSRAIAGTMAFYFLTVVLSVFPGVSIEDLLRRVFGDFLGLGISDSYYALFASLLSPARAYVNAMVGVLDANAGTIVPSNAPVYLQPGVQSLVLVGWIGVPVVLGIIVFRRAEIG